MPYPRHLKSAPISEAIIDIRVKAKPGLQASEFASLRPILVNQFPKVEERYGGKVTVQGLPASPQSRIEDISLQGLFFRSADDKLIAQFRIDGFTLNRLKPYTNSNELLSIAMELWKSYCQVASPQVVTRLALRYINHIPLSSELTDFGQYLRAAPTLPPELPQNVSAFFSRITIHDPDKSLASHIVQALETNLTLAARNITLILDIDAFREVELPPTAPDILTTFGHLRDFKNLVFFSYLTEETIRRFE